MSYIIKDIAIVNEGKIQYGDVIIKNSRIDKMGGILSAQTNTKEINGSGKYLLPGVIDDQVHFREPGLTHKATIYTEAKAAVAGGVTSFMEMPNTVPPAFTQGLLEEKYAVAAKTSLANYSFFMGTSNDNADEVLKTNDKKQDVCGIKIFMGSSTGNLLVENPVTLHRIFENSELLIATHCEEETIIKTNYEKLKKIKPVIEPADHPVIRNEEACFESSLKAIQIAKKYNTRLHILHISTEKELQLFGNMMPLAEKRITAEVCVHHLHFTAADYALLGNRIKCNPAIKAAHNKAALWPALLDNRLDIIATDHAPHTLAEKGYLRNDKGQLELAETNEGILAYEKAHAGLPLVQHSLQLMLYYVQQGKLSIEKVAEKMSHAPATCFRISERGYLREGYYADMVIVDMNDPYMVKPENILYKSGWSPLEGFVFPASISYTFVNGNMVYGNNVFDESIKGLRLRFEV